VRLCVCTLVRSLGGGFKRDIFVDSLYLILLLTLTMASLYELRELSTSKRGAANC
jgi:hypothetical protein